MPADGIETIPEDPEVVERCCDPAGFLPRILLPVKFRWNRRRMKEQDP